jgi:hypothetical protein
VLPTDTADLENIYQDVPDMENIANDDSVYVEQSAAGEYAIHQYKDVGAQGSATFVFKGKSSLPTGDSLVYLQIYNRNTDEWENMDQTVGTLSAHARFTLTANKADLTNYKDAFNMVVCRVYQNGG